jgi:hypothetical protein
MTGNVPGNCGNVIEQPERISGEPEHQVHRARGQHALAFVLDRRRLYGVVRRPQERDEGPEWW